MRAVLQHSVLQRRPCYTCTITTDVGAIIQATLSHPESAVGGSCAALAVSTAIVLPLYLQQVWQLRRERETVRRTRGEKDGILTELRTEREHSKREFSLKEAEKASLFKELQHGRERLQLVQQEKNELFARQQRLQHDIAHRGSTAEGDLEALLASSGLEYELQHVLPSGRKPDCVVHLPWGLKLVVDMKAPTPPHELLLMQMRDSTLMHVHARPNDEVAPQNDEDDGRDATAMCALQQRYVEGIKAHIRDLKDRNYPAELQGAHPFTYLCFPGEGYLGAVLPAGAVVTPLHHYAAERGVTLITITRLASLLRFFKEVDDSEQRLTLMSRITPDLVHLHESHLAQAKKMGQALNRLAKLYDEQRTSLVSFDEGLRAALEIPMSRKTNLPPKPKPLAHSEMPVE